MLHMKNSRDENFDEQNFSIPGKQIKVQIDFCSRQS